MLMVKSEENIGRHRIHIADGSSSTASRSVKRRRRDPPLVAAVGITSDEAEQKQPQVPAATPIATAITVKRSSRFRGVSRYLNTSWTKINKPHIFLKNSNIKFKMSPQT